MGLPESGARGDLYLDGNRVVPLFNWKASFAGSVHPYAANDTGGAKRRVFGVEDTTGTFQVALEETGGCAPTQRGRRHVAQFHVNASGNDYYEVPIMIESIDMEPDIQEGAPILFDVTWGADGLAVAYGKLLECLMASSSSSGEV